MKFVNIKTLKPFINKKINAINQKLSEKHAPKVFLSNQTNTRLHALKKMKHYHIRYDLRSHVAHRWQDYYKHFGHLVMVKNTYFKYLKLTQTKPNLTVEYDKNPRFSILDIFIRTKQNEVKYDYAWQKGLANVWNAEQIKTYCLNHLSQDKKFKNILQQTKLNSNLQTLDIDLKYYHCLTLRDGDGYFSPSEEGAYLDYERHLERINPQLAKQQMKQILVSPSELNSFQLEQADKAGMFHEWSMKQVAKYSQKRLQNTNDFKVWHVYYSLYNYAKADINNGTFSYDYPIKHADKLMDADEVEDAMHSFCVSTLSLRKPINDYAKAHGLDKIKTLAQLENAKKALTPVTTK